MVRIGGGDVADRRCGTEAAAAGSAAGLAGAGLCRRRRLFAEPMSEALSPSSSSTAMTALTLTFSVPAGTMILPTTPSSTASTSIVALSVSISAITSPETTCRLRS
jgi:hypothetical protein